MDVATQAAWMVGQPYMKEWWELYGSTFPDEGYRELIESMLRNASSAAQQSAAADSA